MTRIDGYDLARAFAIFGMVLVNFKIAIAIGAGPDSVQGPDWLRFLTSLFEGRAAALFVVLAGVGLTLGSRRAVEAGDSIQISAARLKLWKRSAFLCAGGLLFALAWPADILHFYGWYIAVGALLISVRSRTLVGLAVLVIAGFVILLGTLDYEVGWDFDTLTYEGFWTWDAQVRHLFFNGFHPVFPWLAFLVFGMWLGRQNLRAPAVRRRVLTWGAGVALITETVSAVLVATLTGEASAEDAELITALVGTGSMPPMPFYMLAAGGTAVAVIALSVGCSERYSRLPGHRALVTTGRLALTIYVAHVLLGLGLLDALGLLEGQTLPFAVAASAVFCVAAVAGASLWTTRIERGPLEWLMRRISG